MKGVSRDIPDDVIIIAKTKAHSFEEGQKARD